MKGLGVDQFHKKKFERLDIQNEELKAMLGNLPRRFIIVVKGDSGNGKTELMLQLTKELCNHGKVAYWQYEQGHGADFQEASMRNDMDRYKGKFIPVDPYENLVVKKKGVIVKEYTLIEDLERTLSKRGGPEFIVIDSVDDAEFTLRDYKRLKHQFQKKKSFILVVRSNSRGTIERKACRNIAFDGQMTLFASDYIVYPKKNRYGGREPYVLWEHEARERNPAFFKKRDQETNGQ